MVNRIRMLSFSPYIFKIPIMTKIKFPLIFLHKLHHQTQDAIQSIRFSSGVKSGYSMSKSYDFKDVLSNECV